jgi:prophage antirepressor-like protein
LRKTVKTKSNKPQNTTNETNIKLFEEKKVRTAWNEDEEEWYFSVVDVVGVLTDSENPRHSPKAEPFKQWLAQVAKQRIDQLQDPELSIEQAMNCLNCDF